MPDIHGFATWPGVESCEWCSYTVSHGISPAVAVMRINPQVTLPDETGDLVFTDGNVTITLPDCKIDSIKSSTGPDGTYWTLEIVDRRWKWRDLGTIDGAYNALDDYGKLVPWAIASPLEMAAACFEELGEETWTADLPDGLSSVAGLGIARTLRPGENFPPTGTNPAVDWKGTPPARALQQLCDAFGRHIVYQVSTDSFAIVIPGQGNDLPPGSIAREQPSINAPETPSGVGVRGSATRFQPALRLQMVALEWDGSYRPAADVSYAPLSAGAVQISTATLTDFSTSTPRYYVTVNGVQFLHTTGGGDTVATVLTDLQNQINGSNAVNKVVTAKYSGAVTLTVTGLQKGVAFSLTVNADTVLPPTAFTAATTQVAVAGVASWANSPPPLFPGIRATDRLTIQDARRLAQQSVWKCYQVVDQDVSGQGPIKVPGYGEVTHRQQILLQDTRVEQATPQPGDQNLKDKSGQPLTLNLYMGVSKDLPAQVWGSAINDAVNALWTQPGTAEPVSFPNTPPDLPYLADFRIDPVNQLVVFSKYVYYWNTGDQDFLQTLATGGDLEEAIAAGDAASSAQLLDPEFVLVTGCLVRENDTNQFVCFEYSEELENAPSQTNFLIKTYPDIQENIVGEYDENWNLTGDVELQQDESDAFLRAKYYTDSLKLQFLPSTAETREYNGFMAIDLDGAISQVTWECGPDGCFTVASRNSEHSIFMPPYPARRRAENLPPAPTTNRIDLGKPPPQA